jgi:hypothetical protein
LEFSALEYFSYRLNCLLELVLKIYIVGGQTGHYSDHSEWVVKAFRTRRVAEKYAAAAEAVAKEIFQRCESGELERWEIDYGKLNQYDPKGVMDYTGTSYYVQEVEFEE